MYTAESNTTCVFERSTGVINRGLFLVEATGDANTGGHYIDDYGFHYREVLPTADNFKKLRIRTSKYLLKDHPKWWDDVFDYFIPYIIPKRWGFLARKSPYLGKIEDRRHWYLGKKVYKTVVKGKERTPKRPYKYGNDPAKPHRSEIYAHLAGTEIIYYSTCNQIVCIDIDDKTHTDVEGQVRLVEMIRDLFPEGYIYADKSKSGCPHIYFKVDPLGERYVKALFKILQEISFRDNTKGKYGALIDSPVCGGPDQIVNIPLFKTEKQWLRFRDLPTLDFTDMLDILRKLCDNNEDNRETLYQYCQSGFEQLGYPVPYGDPEDPFRVYPLPPKKEKAPPPLAAPQTTRKLSQPRAVAKGMAKKLLDQTYKYADHSKYPSRFFDAANPVSFLCAKAGMEFEEMCDHYARHISDDGEPDLTMLLRAWERQYHRAIESLKEVKSEGRFKFSRRKYYNIRNYLSRIIRHIPDELLSVSSLFLYCVSYSTLSSDGGVSRKGFLLACEYAKDDGLISFKVTRRDYEKVREILEKHNLDNSPLCFVSKQAVPPPKKFKMVGANLVVTRGVGKATIYKVPGIVIDWFKETRIKRNRAEEAAELAKIIKTKAKSALEAMKEEIKEQIKIKKRFFEIRTRVIAEEMRHLRETNKNRTKPTEAVVDPPDNC